MVLKKFVSFVYSFIGLRWHPRIKDAAAAAACRRITVDVSGNVKQGVLESPVGSSSSEIIEAEGEYCCVCLSRLKADEDTSALPCLHRFHKVCIEGWFNNVCRRTCPLCRSSMGGEERSHKREEQFTEEMVIWFSSFHVAGFWVSSFCTFWHLAIKKKKKNYF
jgi:hypothetical protein